jgi:aminoglycoside 2''-phosphotransferase
LPYSREVGNPEHWRCVIQSCFPDLDVQSICYLSEGWSSTVWEVNGSHVFRFPKRSAVDSGLRKEIRLLPGLGRALSLPVPQFDFIWQGGPEYEGVFAGYPKLPGAPLVPPHATWQEALADDGAVQSRAKDGGRQLRPRTQDGEAVQIAGPARQLGEFLASLHSFPVSQAIALGIMSGDSAGWREEYRALYGTLQQRILPLLDEATGDKLSRVWSEFVDEPANFQFRPVLIHRDLCAEHILFDPEQGCISGILDWEDAAIGDPAFDFAGLLDLGPEFVQGIWAAYRGSRGGGMLKRARFYRAIAPCYEVLFGLDCGLPEHMTAGLKELRDTFGRLK